MDVPVSWSRDATLCSGEAEWFVFTREATGPSERLSSIVGLKAEVVSKF